MGPLICLRHVGGDDVGIGEQVAREHGLPLVYAGPLDQPPPPVERIGGLVVLGGRENVDQITDHPHLATERELVRAAVDRGVPVLGICLGAQMLARALGAEVRRAPVRELGFVPLSPTPALAADPLFGSFRNGDRLFQWHEDTFAPPAGATLLMTGADVRNQAYRVGDRAWGMQFHAEVTPAKLDRWVTDPASRLHEWGGDADHLRAEGATHLPAQVDRFRTLFTTFVRLVI